MKAPKGTKTPYGTLYPPGTKTLPFRNVAKDFSSDFVLLGRTKSGRLKVGDISGHSPAGMTVYKNRLTKVEQRNGKRTHYIHTGGSILNSYYWEE